MSVGDSDHTAGGPQSSGADNDDERGPTMTSGADRGRSVTADSDAETIFHIVPDDLAAIAVHPDLIDDDHEAHLDWCVRCRREVETMRRVTQRARRADPSEPALAPPEHVWEEVVRELSATGDLDGSDAPAPRPATAVGRWQSFALAAAIVLIAVLAAAVILPLTGDGGGLGGDGDVIALADLTPPDGVELPADSAPAAATLVTAEGGWTVEVDDLDLPPTDGFYELWLLTRDGDQLVSLGPVGGEAQSVFVPDSIDTREFSVVDISREPPDGDPSHSTDSVLRGAFESDV